MRYLISFALLLGIAQGQTFGSCASHQTLTNTADTVSLTASIGELVVLMAHQDVNNTSTVTITDSSGGSNTWTQVGSYSDWSTLERTAMFYSILAANITTITSTWTGPLSDNINTTAMRWTGMAASSPLDASVNANQGSGTKATSGALTTTNANDALIFAVGVHGFFTSPVAGSGYTLPTSCGNGRDIMTYQIVSATQSAVTTTSTWTTALPNSSVFAGFKALAVAGKCSSCDMSRVMPAKKEERVN